MANADYTTDPDDVEMTPELEAFIAGWDTECFILGNPEAEYDTSAIRGTDVDLIEAFAAGCNAAADTASDVIEGDVL